MGCGKTTLGRKLAAKLNYPFIDLDVILEQQTGVTIADYFAAHGETNFRELESKVLKEIVYPKNAIISTGGGLPCFFDNMDWMNTQGTTIYIKLTPGMLASRLEHEKHKRPLISNLEGDGLIDFIEAKLKDREKFYLKADYIIGNKITVDGIIELVKVLP